MTKEELKKEVEEYAKFLLAGTEFEDDGSYVIAYSRKELVEAVLHFAEPREKRIAELEYAKTIIQDLLDNSDEYARERAMNFLKEEV